MPILSAMSAASVTSLPTMSQYFWKKIDAITSKSGAFVRCIYLIAEITPSLVKSTSRSLCIPFSIQFGKCFKKERSGSYVEEENNFVK